MEIEEMIELLYDKDDNIAYKNLQELEKLSNKDDDIYKYMDEFIEMLKNQKKFIRVRGFRLICINSKWDNQGKIDKNLDNILSQLEDEKAIYVRQYLKAVKDIVINKKELNTKIKEKLIEIDYSEYKETMQGLIYKDIEELLKIIKNNGF